MSPDRTVMPGQVWGLATHDATGPIFVTSYAGRNLDTTVLTAIDTTGDIMFRPGLDGDIETWRDTSDARTEEVQQ
jgi:hypothetical protein